MIYSTSPRIFRCTTPKQWKGSPTSRGASYVDALAKASASERCVRCPGQPGWKTAAIVYGGPQWDYCYCYECRRWFVRDAKYRYATSNMDEPAVIGRLLAMLELQKEMTETQLEILAWFRRRFSTICWSFRKLARWPDQSGLPSAVQT